MAWTHAEQLRGVENSEFVPHPKKRKLFFHSLLPPLCWTPPAFCNRPSSRLAFFPRRRCLYVFGSRVFPAWGVFQTASLLIWMPRGSELKTAFLHCMIARAAAAAAARARQLLRARSAWTCRTYCRECPAPTPSDRCEDWLTRATLLRARRPNASPVRGSFGIPPAAARGSLEVSGGESVGAKRGLGAAGVSKAGEPGPKGRKSHRPNAWALPGALRLAFSRAGTADAGITRESHRELDAAAAVALAKLSIRGSITTAAASETLFEEAEALLRDRFKGAVAVGGDTAAAAAEEDNMNVSDRDNRYSE